MLSVVRSSISGKSTRRFAFEAFLPPDKKERALILEELKKETRTIVLYEAPHHLVRTLAELKNTMGDEREVSVVKELTKRYESCFRTTLKEAVTYYEENEPKGEYVIVISGKSFEDIAMENVKQWEEMTISEHYDFYINQGKESKEAMKLVAKDRNISKRDVYSVICIK